MDSLAFQVWEKGTEQQQIQGSLAAITTIPNEAETSGRPETEASGVGGESGENNNLFLHPSLRVAETEPRGINPTGLKECSKNLTVPRIGDIS